MGGAINCRQNQNVDMRNSREHMSRLMDRTRRRPRCSNRHYLDLFLQLYDISHRQCVFRLRVIVVSPSLRASFLTKVCCLSFLRCVLRGYEDLVRSVQHDQPSNHDVLRCYHVPKTWHDITFSPCFEVPAAKRSGFDWCHTTVLIDYQSQTVFAVPKNKLALPGVVFRFKRYNSLS